MAPLVDRLRDLGYLEQLGSDALVERLLEDVLKTTRSYESIKSQEAEVASELGDLRAALIPLRKDNAKLQRETNALHAELLAKAASRNDEDAAEREAHAETRRKLVKAKGLLGKHGVTWDESEDVIGDPTSLQDRIRELETQLSSNEDRLERAEKLSRERRSEVDRLSALVSGSATAAGSGLSATIDAERAVDALRRQVRALTIEVADKDSLIEKAEEAQRKAEQAEATAAAATQELARRDAFAREGADQGAKLCSDATKRAERAEATLTTLRDAFDEQRDGRATAASALAAVSAALDAALQMKDDEPTVEVKEVKNEAAWDAVAQAQRKQKEAEAELLEFKAKEEALNASLQASQKKMDAMAQSLKQAEAATKASPYVVLDEPAAEGWRAKFEDAERRALDLESRLGGAEARAAGAEAAAETRQRIIDTLQSQKAGQTPPSPPPVPRSTQPRPVADPTPLLQERSKVTTLQAEVKERDERLKALAAELEASKLRSQRADAALHELREQLQKSEDHRTEALQEAASAKAAVQAAASVSDAVVATETQETPSAALSTRHALDEAALEAAQDEIAQLKAVVKQIEGTRSQMRDERARALMDVEKARRACAEKDAQFAAERAGAKASLDEVQRLRKALNELDCERDELEASLRARDESAAALEEQLAQESKKIVEAKTAEDAEATRARRLERALASRDAEMASANLRLDALGKAVADARRASQDRAELLEAARDDLRCMTRENQAVHAELAKTAEQAKKATAAQQRLDRDRETLRQQALRAKVERDDALHVYRATCREKDAARKGADAAALAQADLRGKLDAAEHKMRAMEAELENARKDASASNTAAGSLEREVAQAAKTSDADQRTIDALRAEIQRLKTAPPAFGQAPQTMRTGGPPMPMPMFPGMPRSSHGLPPPASAPGARPTTAAGRIDALLAQARFAATNMPVPTA
jgi:chromosome segregation ATPase